MRGVTLAVVVAVALVACGGDARDPGKAAPPPRAAVPEPLVLLHRYEVAMCACTTEEYEASHQLGDECPGDPSGKTNAMIADPSWRRTLDAQQNAEADRLLDRIRRCFQASEGDPLPPAH
jgi:hypothetical protein